MVVRLNTKNLKLIPFKSYRSTAGYDLKNLSYQSFDTRIQEMGTNYTHLSDITITTPDASYPTTKDASSMLK